MRSSFLLAPLFTLLFALGVVSGIAFERNTGAFEASSAWQMLPDAQSLRQTSFGPTEMTSLNQTIDAYFSAKCQALGYDGTFQGDGGPDYATHQAIWNIECDKPLPQYPVTRSSFTFLSLDTWQKSAAGATCRHMGGSLLGSQGDDKTVIPVCEIPIHLSKQEQAAALSTFYYKMR